MIDQHCFRYGEDNIGSENTMRACGAIYENTVNNIDGEKIKRYGIKNQP